MGKITVLTWLWSQPGGRATYTAHHVNIWADMVRRNLTIPFELACVTGTPEGIDPAIRIIAPPGDFEGERLPTWAGDKPQCLRRLSMFRRDAADIFGARFVSMDLDCVIAGNLDSLFDRPEDIVLYRSPSGGRPNPRHYNGSMLMMTAGARPQVFDNFEIGAATDASRLLVGSDQAWISHVLGAGEATWDQPDGVFWWRRVTADSIPRLMFFPGNPKPWDIVLTRENKWVAEHYRANPKGKCLYLGYGPTLWADVAAAGNYDAVICSPEAARVWPGVALDIADNQEAAERLAAMHGYDCVSCGVFEDAECSFSA